MHVPADALHVVQTARAAVDFQVSSVGIGREMIRALGQIKAAAAEVNAELGLLDRELAGAALRPPPVGPRGTTRDVRMA